MSDGNEAATQQENTPSRPRGRLAGPFVVIVLICTVGSVSAGAVLTNMDWPDRATDWLRFALGGILVVGGTMLGEVSRKQLTRYFQNRRRDPDSRYSPSLLHVVDQLTKRRLFAVPAIAVAILAVAVITPPLIGAQPEPPLEAGEIVIMSGIDEGEADARYTLIQQWNSTHPDNQVTFRKVSGETDQQHDNMVKDAQKAAGADVYLLDVVWMPEFIAKSYIQPIDQNRLVQDTDDFLTNVLDTCRERGDRRDLWALPFNSDAGLMYYRSDLVDPLPRTWSGYYGQAAKETLRTARTGTIQSATAAQLANEEVLTVSALEAMLAAGSEIVSEDGVVLQNGDVVEFDRGALAALRDLATAAHDQDIVLPDSLEADETTSAEAMQAGRALFMRNWPVAYDDLVNNLPEPTASIGVARLPWDSVLGGQNLAIAASTDKPRAAQALIEFLTSPSSQLILFDRGGYAPTRNSAYIHSRRIHREAVRDAVERARPRPWLVNYSEFSKEFRAGVLRAVNNNGVIEADLPRRLAEIVNKG